MTRKAFKFEVNLPSFAQEPKPTPKGPQVNPDTGLTRAEELVLEEYLARQPYDALACLFPLQRAFVDDPNDRKSLLCSRRSGKTYTCLQDLVDTALKTPNSVCVYIGLDRKSAKKIFWSEIVKLFEAEKRLKSVAKLNHSELTVTFKNGSQLWVTGATDESDIEKLRGNKFSKVYIDEAASFPEFLLKKLVEDIIEPALIDLAGTLCLMGTPGPRYTDETGGKDKAGLFYGATTFDKEWAQHSWTLLDNPHLKNPSRVIENILRRRNWSRDNPSFLREYCGKWVKSTDKQVYSYSESLTNYENIPKREDWVYILSLDVGTRDQTAFVLSCFSEKDPNWWVLEAYGKSNMAPDDIAAKIKSYKQLYPIERVVMDCGGLGLAVAEHFRKTHSLAITPAEKKEKLAFIEFFNGDMNNGRIKVKAKDPATYALIEQWQSLTMGDDGKEDKHAKNDLCDAALYGYRHARQYLFKGPTPHPIQRPTEDQQMKKFWAEQAREAQKDAVESHPFSYLTGY